MDNVIEKIKENLEEVASMPHVAAKALDLLNKDDVSVIELSKVFELDMVLTGKLLRIVNSAYYGFAKKISSVRQALTILGIENIKSILISTIAFDIFRKERQSSLDSNGLWIHSLATATFAQAIAKEMKLDKPEEYYIAGLLHDIGKVILIQILNTEFNSVLEMAKNNRMTLYDAEEQLLKTNHSEVGYTVACHWKLPKSLASSIRFHHNVSVSIEDEIVTKMASVVQFADFFCNIQHIGESGSVKVALIQKEVKETVTISAEERKTIIQQVKEDVSRAKSFFEIS